MPTPLALTVVDIQPDAVTVSTSDGQRLTLPLETILGKPQLNQPLFLLAATSGAEPGLTHPLAHEVIQQLLTPLP